MRRPQLQQSSEQLMAGRLKELEPHQTGTWQRARQRELPMARRKARRLGSTKDSLKGLETDLKRVAVTGMPTAYLLASQSVPL